MNAFIGTVLLRPLAALVYPFIYITLQPHQLMLHKSTAVTIINMNDAALAGKTAACVIKSPK